MAVKVRAEIKGAPVILILGGSKGQHSISGVTIRMDNKTGRTLFTGINIKRLPGSGFTLSKIDHRAAFTKSDNDRGKLSSHKRVIELSALLFARIQDALKKLSNDAFD